jgi:SAM-dependent methyltransferase
MMPNQAAGYWDRHVGEHIGSFTSWDANPPIMQSQNWKVSGDPYLTHVEWFCRKYGPFQKAASIGSGNGILERTVCSLPNVVGTIVGHDISPRSVELASQSCAEFKNASFVVADLNIYNWPPETFDVIFAHGALHHIEALDWCLRQMCLALTADGILYVNDYVGPAQFQWSDEQMRFADELLKNVPQQWLKSPSVIRCDPDKLRADDPSEAICSNTIEETIAAHFEIIERKLRGGTLLAPIFGSGCLDISILDSVEGLRCLADLAQREDELVFSGAIPSDHVIIVARKKTA